MPTSRPTNEELNEDVDPSLHSLWGTHPSITFHGNFEREENGNLVDSIVITAMMFSANDLKESFSASENKIRNMKTLALYYHYLQTKGEASFRFSGITKKDCDNFKSQPRNWSSVSKDFQNELNWYLSSPDPETLELIHEELSEPEARGSSPSASSFK